MGGRDGERKEAHERSENGGPADANHRKLFQPCQYGVASTWNVLATLATNPNHKKCVSALSVWCSYVLATLS